MRAPRWTRSAMYIYCVYCITTRGQKQIFQGLEKSRPVALVQYSKVAEYTTPLCDARCQVSMMSRRLFDWARYTGYIPGL